MSTEVNHPDDFPALEAALAALKPRVKVIDRDRLMYRAGQAAARRDGVALSLAAQAKLACDGNAAAGLRHSWHWPAACASLTIVAAILMLLVIFRPVIRIVERSDWRAPTVIASGQGAARPLPPSNSARENPSTSAARIAPERSGAVLPWTWALFWLPAKPNPTTPNDLSYPAVRDQWLETGLQAWNRLAERPETPPALRDSRPATYQNLLDQFLDHQQNQAVPLKSS